MLLLFLSYFVFKISVPSVNASGKLKIEVLYSVCTHDYCWMKRQFDRQDILKTEKIKHKLESEGIQELSEIYYRKHGAIGFVKIQSIYYRDIWFLWTSLVAQTVKRLSTMQETWVRSLGREDLLEKEMAIHSSTIAWKIPWTEEPDRLQSMGSQRVGHD